MTVIKNPKSNTYEVRTYYKDWTGVRKQKTKRGFKRKCDAQEWERAFKLKENLSMDMYFEDFVDLYLNDIKSRSVLHQKVTAVGNSLFFGRKSPFAFMLTLAKPIIIVEVGVPFCLSIFGEILISRHLNPPLLNKCVKQM